MYCRPLANLYEAQAVLTDKRGPVSFLLVPLTSAVVSDGFLAFKPPFLTVLRSE